MYLVHTRVRTTLDMSSGPSFNATYSFLCIMIILYFVGSMSKKIGFLELNPSFILFFNIIGSMWTLTK